MNDYPRMLYKAGQVGKDWRIVKSAEEEAAAAKDDYTSAKAETPKDDKAKAKK